MPIRTFIALEIPGASLNQIIEIRNKTLGESVKAKWEAKDKLHLTLKFLGETGEELVEQVNTLLETVLSKYNSLELAFEKFGVFTKENKPRILWLGLMPNNNLVDLANELNSQLAGLGFEKEKRAFSPHITLLRFRGYEDSEKVLSLTKVILPEIKFTAGKVIFFESKLLRSGSIYKPIKSFYLKN